MVGEGIPSSGGSRPRRGNVLDFPEPSPPDARDAVIKFFARRIYDVPAGLDLPDFFLAWLWDKGFKVVPLES